MRIHRLDASAIEGALQVDRQLSIILLGHREVPVRAVALDIEAGDQEGRLELLKVGRGVHGLPMAAGGDVARR